MKSLNPSTNSYWVHGDQNEKGMFFHSYRRGELDSGGFFKIKWLTRKAFEKNKESCKKRSRAIRARNRDLMHKRKLQRGCECCGYKQSAVALDFDHKVPDEKINEVALMGTASREKLIQEMDKCRILCANCHRIKTYEPEKFATMLNSVRVLTI